MRKEVIEEIKSLLATADQRYPNQNNDRIIYSVTYAQLRKILTELEKKPHVIISIDGGVCKGAVADMDMSFDVLDHDNWGRTVPGSEEDKWFEDLQVEFGKLGFTIF